MASKKITPAKLSAGEPVISKEMAEKAKEHLSNTKISEGLEDSITITAPNKAGKGGKKKSSLSGLANNDTIGMAEKKTAEKPAAKAGPKKATVAIYSERNMHWSGVGEISKGYNIVSPEAAEEWLKRKHVREATPEEVASEYGA